MLLDLHFRFSDSDLKEKMAEESKISLKLLVDTNSRKVLFAEASKDFVDVLFRILSLPIGTIVELLKKKGMAGCLEDLCKSIEELNLDYLQPNVTKDAVLKPTVVDGSTEVEVPQLLLINCAPTSNKKYYRCDSNRYGCRSYVSDGDKVSCPECSYTMSCVMSYVSPKALTEATPSSSVNSGGYVKGVVTYMVMDNLEVKPMSTISCVALINRFSVKDVSALVEKEVQVGVNEWLAILKASLETRAALTTAFLGVKEDKN